MLLGKRLLFAAASGLSTWPLAHILKFLEPILPGATSSAASYISTGAVFGVLVLAPLVNAGSLKLRRVIVLVVGSILIYALAVESATGSYGPLDLDHRPAIIVSGVLGALLVGALTMLAAPLRISGKRWSYLLIAGLFGGVLFSFFFLDQDHELFAAAGYVVWQGSVCVALNFGRTADP